MLSLAFVAAGLASVGVLSSGLDDGAHLSISDETHFLCSAGLVRASFTTTAPSASSRFRKSASCSAVFSAALTLSSTAFGVPFGA
ncbi:hypothetical protein X551_00076 [Methylibium sp. T29]|nr:hypothetical protein X551_00076 [Methylibium sp. T29]